MGNVNIFKNTELLALGIATIIGIIWQYRVLKKDIAGFRRRRMPSRIVYAAFLCLALMVGIIVRGLIAMYMDPRGHMTYDRLYAELGMAVSFSLLFLLQAYFGPVVTSVAIVMVAYFFFEYRELYMLPIIQTTVDLLSSIGPDWTENTYTIIMGSYTLVTSYKDSVA